MTSTYEARPHTTAPPSPPSTAPRRIACDRCHGQKLKCPRDITGGGPCTRCAKAGAICQVSPARATGRPAKNPKPQPQHKKSESTMSINSSRPSLVESSSSSSIDEDLATPGSRMGGMMGHGRIPSPEDYFPNTAMPCLPMTSDAKFYPTQDMQFDFVNVVDPTFVNSMGFDFDDGMNYLDFGTLPTMMPSTYPQHSPISMGFPGAQPQYGVMPPPPTPTVPMADEAHTPEDKFGGQSRRGSFAHDAMMSPPLGTPPLKRGFTMSDVHLVTTNLPIRPMPSDTSSAKKRRFSSMVTCTPENEDAWSSHLSHSQALSTIQFEVDNFSKTLMNQSMGTGPDALMRPDATVDIGVLLPISDKFVALVPQICQQAALSPVQTKNRSNSGKQYSKPPLERSQTESDLTSPDPSGLDSGLLQLIFACQTRLHFAFSIALDIISRNLATAHQTFMSTHHPSSSIGSYTLPNSSPLSTLLHLHAISHSLDRIDATLEKHLGTESVPSSGFFEGIFCKQKRSEMAMHAFRERAFEEATERKNLLMSRIRAIVAEVAGHEI